MIKTIIFDFDGVIVESADIKTQAFVEIFADYPQKREEIINYHLINAGISRYIKFRHIYKQILGQELSKEKELKLGERFSQIVLQQILNAPLVAGAKEFLDANKSRYQFFIASGTPEEELRNIINIKGLQQYFKEIHGSPRKKTEIISEIRNKYGFDRKETIFIGDAESDRLAAEEAQIAFIEHRPNLGSKSEGPPWRIRDLFNLEGILGKINVQKQKKSN